MADSIREKISQALESRLKTILVSAGYNVDFGLNVNRAKRSYSDDDLPAITLWMGSESVKNEYGNDKRSLVIDVELINVVDDNETLTNDVLINKIIADTQKCIGTYDATLMDLIDGIQETSTEPIYPDKGSDIISARLTYEIKYFTVKGDPTLQP